MCGLVCGFVWACGSEKEPDYPRIPPSVAMPLEAESKPPKGKLWRHDVDAVVEAGLGRFLQRVEVEPSLSNGRFRGFRIIELRPPGFWREVDLKKGDVVTRVNGMPIEREMQAYEAFVSLKKADKLRVSFQRGGERRELVYGIVVDPKHAKSAQPSRKGPAPARAPQRAGAKPTAVPKASRPPGGKVKPAGKKTP